MNLVNKLRGPRFYTPDKLRYVIYAVLALYYKTTILRFLLKDSMLITILLAADAACYHTLHPRAHFIGMVNFNQAWIGNYIHYKVWDKITY